MKTFEEYIDIKYDVKQISDYMQLMPILTLNKFLIIMINKIKTNTAKKDIVFHQLFIKTVGIHLLKYAELQGKLEYALLLRPFVYAIYQIDNFNIPNAKIDDIKYVITILYNSLNDIIIKKLFVLYCDIVLEISGLLEKNNKSFAEFLNSL